jgi:arylmalonate decarboxylase
MSERCRDKKSFKPYPLGWKAKIGILLPSHDTGYGPYEYRKLCPDGVVTLETRVMGGILTVAQLTRMREDALHGAELLATANPDVISYIPTAACFVIGVEEERALLEQIESTTGIKAVSGGTSVAAALRFMGAKKMSMYVPTNEEITQKTVQYFEDQGFEVCAYDSLYEEKLPDINRMSPQEIYGNVLKLYRRCPEVEGIFITGGCFRTLEVLEILEKDTGIPMVTTTPANMFRCLQVVGVNDPIIGFGQLLEKDRLS